MSKGGNGYILSQGEYAKRRGISQPMVAKLLRQGKLDGAYVKEGRFYKINPIKADQILSTFENPAMSKRVLSSAPPSESLNPGSFPAPTVLTAADPDPGAAPSMVGLLSFAEAARREKQAKAVLLELKLKRERGELIERERVEAVAAKLATLVRVGIEAIPSRVAPAVAGMSKPAEVSRYLQSEIKIVLNNLAEGITDLDL